MSDPVILGIDISKQNDVALLIGGSKLKYKSCKNSAEGFELLSQWLHKQGVDRLHACLGFIREMSSINLAPPGFITSRARFDRR